MTPAAAVKKLVGLVLALLALAVPIGANELWVAPAKNSAGKLIADFAVAQKKTHFGFGVPDNFTGFTRATVLLIGGKDQEISYDLTLSISQNLGSARAFVAEMRGIPATVFKDQLLELDVSAIFGGAPALQPGADYVSLSVDIDSHRSRRRGEREDQIDDERNEAHSKDTDTPRALLFGLRFQYESPTGPQGPAGATGPQGPIGPTGPAGANGLVTAVVSGGGITGNVASNTLTLGSDSTVQRRTSGSPMTCPVGQYLQAVAADGAPTCVADPTVRTCAEGDILRYVAGAWQCTSIGICIPSYSQPCYSGAPATQGVGVCTAGTQVCGALGQYGACTGQILPTTEVCANGLDDDCDGQTDEGCGVCTPGQVEVCYTGTPATQGVGACVAGSRTCGVSSQWGACGGEILPIAEVCANGIDDDCDGQTDEGCIAAVCGNGILELGEACDDNNLTNGDACGPTCRYENTTSLFAGQPGTAGTSDGVGGQAHFSGGSTLMATAGYLYMTEGPSHTIRRIDIATGAVTTIAGFAGPAAYVDDPVGPNARFSSPDGIATDGVALFVGDAGNRRIRRIAIAPPHAVTTVAGSGVPGIVDAIGTAAQLDAPRGLAYSGGLVYFLEAGQAVLRSFDPVSGVVATLAGTPGVLGTGDGFGALARFTSPRYMTAGGAGRLYISDTNGNKIRTFDIATTFVGTLAGDGPGYVDGMGTAARIDRPRGITFDGTSVYFAESDQHTLRQIVVATAEVSTMVGLPAPAPPAYVEGVGTAARLNAPFGLVRDPVTGRLFVHDGSNFIIRQIQ